MQKNTRISRGSRFAAIVRSMLRASIRSFNVGKSICFKQVAAERNRSSLALFWDIGDPLLMGLAFIILYQYKAIDASGMAMPFSFYVIAGVMVWQCLIDAINIPLKIIGASRELLLNTQVAPEALIWACIIRALYNSLFKILIVIGFAGYFSSFSLMGVFIGVLFIALSIALISSIGILLAPFNAITDDVYRFVNLVLRPMMFVSGVVFPITGFAMLESVNRFNILATIIETFRNLIVVGFVDCSWRLGISLLSLLVIFLVAWYVFHVSIRVVAERS